MPYITVAMTRSVHTSEVAAAQRAQENPASAGESAVWQAMRAATAIIAASKNEAEN